jgi:hypothetical protein
MSPAGRCAAQTRMEAASPPLTVTKEAAALRPGDAPREGTGPPLQRQGCCASPAATALRAGLERWSLCAPSGRKHGQAPACPGPGHGTSGDPVSGAQTNARETK